jgi:RNA recognition motif-containing protein
MAKKLYVGSLPYKATEDQLRELFSKAGEVVSVAIIIDKFSGQSKGFGFVEMASDEEATRAIDMLNGSQMGERTIVVNEARTMAERPPRDNSRGGSGDRRGGREFGSGPRSGGSRRF